MGELITLELTKKEAKLLKGFLNLDLERIGYYGEDAEILYNIGDKIKF